MFSGQGQMLICFITLFQKDDPVIKCPTCRHCEDLRALGDSGVGVRTVYPYGDTSTGVQVLCDQETDGGGWTIIQQRKYTDGVSKIDFFRNWADYQRGFGNIDPNGEFWMGNDFIHHLTSTLGLKVGARHFCYNYKQKIYI